VRDGGLGDLGLGTLGRQLLPVVLFLLVDVGLVAVF